MKLRDLIKVVNESPLPDGGDDFDKDQQKIEQEIFDESTPYFKRMKYVKARAELIGEGSARSAFKIMYKGRKTILKVAHNKVGAAQNAVEAAVLDKIANTDVDLVIPQIDHDVTSDSRGGKKLPAWIHMEYAKPATEEQLCDFMKCGTLEFLVSAMLPEVPKEQADWTFEDVESEIRENFPKYTDEDMITFKKYVGLLAHIVNENNLMADDFIKHDNWGIYKGKPVIIDIGFTHDIQISHYE